MQAQRIMSFMPVLSCSQFNNKKVQTNWRCNSFIFSFWKMDCLKMLYLEKWHLEKLYSEKKHGFKQVVYSFVEEKKYWTYLLKFLFLSCCSRACIFFTILDFSWMQHCWIADWRNNAVSLFNYFVMEINQNSKLPTLTAVAISLISSPIYSFPVPLKGIFVLTMLTKTPILSCVWLIL